MTSISKWTNVRADEIPELTEYGFTEVEFGMLNSARGMIRAGEALMADAHQDALKRKAGEYREKPANTQAFSALDDNQNAVRVAKQAVGDE